MQNEIVSDQLRLLFDAIGELGSSKFTQDRLDFIEREREKVHSQMVSETEAMAD